MQFKQSLLAGALALVISPLALSGASSSTSYQYDEKGKVTQIDGPRTDVQDITQFRYNEKGKLVKVINALGHTTRLENHNVFGNPLQITDANGTITNLSYDEMGWLTQSTIKSSAGDITTRFEYDAIGQVTAVFLPNGSELHYEYDTANRLTAIQNGLGERVEYQHDNAGNITKQVVKSSTGSVVRQFSQAYDEMSRLLTTVGANGQTSQYQYDKNSNTKGATNPRNFKTGNAFDALNRLVTTTDALNQNTQFKYDAQDNLTQVTDPRGVTTTYQYDGLGRLVKEISPSSGATVYAHDAAGNVVQKTDGRGVVTKYSYDALNRKTSRTYPATPELNVTYLYDDTAGGSKGIGRLTGVQDQSGLIAYHYNDRGNQTKTMRSVNLNGTDQFFGVVNGYNLASQLTSIQYPSGLTISYQRNSDGQVSQVTGQWKGGASFNLANNIGYVPFGPLQQLTWANGKTLQRQFDQDLQLTAQTVLGIQELSYQHDPNGNITGINNLLTEANSSSYGYDPLDRLIEEQADYGTKSYKYDPVGNRTERVTEKDGKKQTQTLTYAENSNRLVSRDEGAVSYDGMGNTENNGNGLQLQYDGQGRLKAVVKGGTTQAQYRYNAIGERIVKELNGETVVYSYDLNGQLLEEAYYNKTTNKLSKTRSYAWLGTQPIAMLEQELDSKGKQTTQQIAYIHSDHLNTPRVATNTAEQPQVIWSWQSDAFGVGLANEDVDGDGQSTVIALRFPGQVFDPESGLHQNYFRDYDPNLGRYIESDPIGLNGGLNTYAYVGGNPLSYADPLGLEAVSGTTLGGSKNGSGSKTKLGGRGIGGLIGGLAGAAASSMADALSGSGDKCGCKEDWIQIYRVVGPNEYASIQASKQYSIYGNQSGWGQKQFWFSLADAYWFAKSEAKMTPSRGKITRYIVTSKICLSTVKLGSQFTDVGHKAISFDAVGLTQVNKDAKQTGGISTLATIPASE